jgi:hypothetical protein
MKKASGVLFVGIIFVSFLLSLSFISAYIDPGTGIAIAGSAWGAIYGVILIIGAFLAKVFIHPIKRFFGRLFGKKEKKS